MKGDWGTWKECQNHFKDDITRLGFSELPWEAGCTLVQPGVGENGATQLKTLSAEPSSWPSSPRSSQVIAVLSPVDCFCFRELSSTFHGCRGAVEKAHATAHKSTVLFAVLWTCENFLTTGYSYLISPARCWNVQTPNTISSWFILKSLHMG